MNTECNKYLRLRIFFFTGTGNAKFAADQIAEEVEKKSVESQVIHISRSDHCSNDFDETTLLGFCYPTHGFNAPPVVLKHLIKFPRGSSDVFLLNTRAGMKLFRIHTPGLGGIALWLPALILKFKGYKLKGFRPLDMPSNWIFLHPGLNKNAVDFISGKCKITLRKFTGKILNRKRVIAGLAWLPLDIMVIPISAGYYIFGRFAFSKTFFASYKCSHCGLCVRGCPVNAIKIKSGRPYWSFSCESCMKCINTCPERAIETAHGFTALLWWLVFSLVPSSLLLLLQKVDVIPSGILEKYSDIIFNFLMIGAGFILLFLGYRILHQALRIKLLNRIITMTSLTHFKFWSRYRFGKNREEGGNYGP